MTAGKSTTARPHARWTRYLFLPVLLGTSGACLDVERQGRQCFTNLDGKLECIMLEVCGNGRRERGEVCDDGNTNSGDGCSSSCVDDAAPALNILFPPDNSFTDAFEITLRGTTSDDTKVAAVRVNGELAALDGGAWQIQVPLLLEQNDFEVKTEDVFGKTTTQNIRVRSRHLFAPAALVQEAPERFLVIDHLRDTLLRIDLVTDEVTTLSGARKGEGPAIEGPRGMALDSQRGRVLVADEVLGALMSIDLASGSRKIFSGRDSETNHDIGGGLPLSRPAAVVLDGDRALVVDYGVDALVSIDLVSGDRKIVSGLGAGGGEALQWPIDLALDEERGRVLAADLALDGLWSIDLDTGDRAIMASSTPGVGCQLEEGLNPYSVEYDPEEDQIVILGRGRNPMAILDPEDCERTQYWNEQNGGGPAFELPTGMALDSGNNRAYVADGVLGVLIEVALETGARTIRTRSRVGEGDAFKQPTRLALDPENGRALVVDTGGKAVVIVDLANGKREIVTGTGCQFQMPVDVAMYPDSKHALVADVGRRALVRVDLASRGCRDVRSFQELPFESFGFVLEESGRSVLAAVGGQGVVSLLRIHLEHAYPDGSPMVEPVSGPSPIDGSEHGMGPPLGVPTGMALDKANDRILVVDFASSELVAIDLATGDRKLISDERQENGPPLVRPTTITVDQEGTYAWVVDLVLQALVRVDLETGNRSLVSYASGTPHGDIERPLGVALDQGKEWAVVVDEEQKTLFRVDLVTGERVIISR